MTRNNHTAASEAKTAGYMAYASGIKHENNPYRYLSISKGGVALQAWWSAGWKEAQRDIEKKERVDGP